MPRDVDGGDFDGFMLRPVGRVESLLTDRAQAPRQGDEGAPDAWIVFDDDVADAMYDLEAIDGTPVLDVKPVLGSVDER